MWWNTTESEKFIFFQELSMSQVKQEAGMWFSFFC